MSVDRLTENDMAADHEAEVNNLHELFLKNLADHKAPKEVMDLWERSSGGETDGGVWAIDYAE